METFFRHYRALALLIDQHFPAHSHPLFHVHVHSSFLMGVPVLVRPFPRAGFHPAFTPPLVNVICYSWNVRFKNYC